MIYEFPYVSSTVMFVLRMLLWIVPVIIAMTVIITLIIRKKRKTHEQNTENSVNKRKRAKGTVIAFVTGIVLWLAVIVANIVFKEFKFIFMGF